ncbi:MAG: sulfatase-like hydrolase/transferase [Phycisphaerae bacterium]|jgi:arylsulfatase|nr:sulfatase-like hydrolase/transferase [Phycisphaerae bacterium]
MDARTFNRRGFLKAAGVGVAALTLGGRSLAAKAAGGDDRPNIVLILADDMGWSDLGCYGSEIKTPHLDRLAKGGVRFTQFYNTAKCFPSRACLLTGVYAQQCGMARGYKAITNAVTLGEVLRSAGYRTLMTGKHHCNENPYDRGFDRYFGLRDGACNFFNPGEQREGEPKPAQKSRKRAWCIDDKTYQPYTPPEKDFYTTDYFAKYAIGYLDQYAKETKPFFLYVAFNAPHDPMMAWPEDIAKYQGKYLVGYEKIRKARYKRMLEMGLIDEKTYALSPREKKSWDSLSDEQKKTEDRRMAVYAAMIDRMDQNIGKLLAKIEEIGKSENTLVIFCSDNGGSAEVVRIGKGQIGNVDRWSSVQSAWANVSNSPFRKFKNYSHEGGICTSMIANWPKGIKNPGRISGRVGHFIDFMATFAEIGKAKYPTEFNGQKITPLEGESMLPAFQDKSADREKPLFWQWSRGKAVRKGKWKLVCWGSKKQPRAKTKTKKRGSRGSGPPAWELYDMEADRTELNDLSAKHPEVVKELAGLHAEWVDKCNKKP